MILKVIFLIAIISLSLMGFQAQEAFAGAGVTITAFTQTSTTIKVCFNEADVVFGTVQAADFQIDDVNAASKADLDGTCNTKDGVTLTAASDFGTAGTPKVVLVTNSGVQHAAVVQNVAQTVAAATDNAPPTYDSAAVVSTTSIDVTFSENMDTTGSIVTGDFTIDNGITVSGVSVNGAVVTLTTSEFSSALSPSVTMGGTVDDASAATNSLTSAGAKTATFSSSLAAQAGDSGSDKSAPSLGSTGMSGVSTIDDGFSYNNVVIDVDGWKNDFPTVRTPVGAVNTLDLKIKENKGITNIYFVSVHFGAPQVGKPGEAIVTYFPNQAEKLKIDDPNNLLGNVDFTVQPTKCTASSSTNSCLEFSLNHVFNEAPTHDVVGITVADISRNAAYAYFNHGVNVYGDSLNPPVTETITDTYDKHTKQIILTQTDRAQDLWLDENDNTWTRNAMNSWIKLTQEEYTVPDDNIIGSNGMKRINQHFVQYKGEQEIIATQIWDGALIKSQIPDAVESSLPEKIMSYGKVELNELIMQESQEAEFQWDGDLIQNDVSDYFEFDYSQGAIDDSIQLQNGMNFEEYRAHILLNELYHSDRINQMGSEGVIIPKMMYGEYHNGALHVDYSKLQDSKSLESDRAKEMLYKMYGKW